MKKFTLIKIFNIDDNTSYMYNGTINKLLKLTRKEEKDILDYIYHITKGLVSKETNPCNYKKSKFIENIVQNKLLNYDAFERNSISELRNKSAKILKYSKSNAIPRKLTLELTNKCNLRCKYCFYTINETLSEGKSHGHVDMDYTTAIKAIDYYFRLYTAIINKLNPEEIDSFVQRNPPIIGFYGGEALINFNLMTLIIKYTNALPWKEFGIKKKYISYALTTNGTLLNESVISFLVKNNIYMNLSLDGPPEENNKNRVFHDGKGSAEIVEKSLLYIKQEYPKYYKRKIQIQAVMAPNYNNDKVYSYFSNLTCGNKFAGVNVFKFLNFNNHGEERFQDNKSEVNLSIIPFVEKNYKNDIVKAINLNPIVREYLKDLFEIYIRLLKFNINNSINSCYVGYSGLFVDVSGAFHMCERTDFSLSIGDIENGLDEKKINKIYIDYYKIHNSVRCRNCWIRTFCKFCIASMSCSGGVKLPNINDCKIARKLTLEKLKDLMILLDKYPKVVKYIENTYSINNDMTLTEYKYEAFEI